MGDTPRTDAEDKIRFAGKLWVKAEFARDLECVLAVARNEISELKAGFDSDGNTAAEACCARIKLQLSAERDKLAEALRKCQANAVAIQKLRWGWDGDCGANRLAEFIEEDCHLALADLQPTVTQPSDPQD